MGLVRRKGAMDAMGRLAGGFKGCRLSAGRKVLPARRAPAENRAWLWLVVSLLAGGAALASASLAAAEELPVFRHGMWEFRRSLLEGEGADRPQLLSSKKCTNPTADMKKQNEMLTRDGGCTFSPVARSGHAYTFTSDCTMRGVALHGKTVITVESDSAYTATIETRQDGKLVSTETLKAQRTGDCP